MPHCDFQRLYQLFKRQYQSHSKASMEAAKLTLTDFHWSCGLQSEIVNWWRGRRGRVKRGSLDWRWKFWWGRDLWCWRNDISPPRVAQLSCTATKRLRSGIGGFGSIDNFGQQLPTNSVWPREETSWRPYLLYIWQKLRATQSWDYQELMLSPDLKSHRSL